MPAWCAASACCRSLPASSGSCCWWEALPPPGRGKGDSATPLLKCPAPRLHRHAHRGPQSAERAVGQHDVAAMRAGDVAGDRKAESGAAFVLIARIVAAEERL